MAVVKQLTTREELEAFVAEHFDDYAPEILRVTGVWAARGDGAAFYQNHDLGHRDLGHIQVASYGSPQAQLETDDPPEVLPDIGGAINWRYQLIGTYR